MNLIVAGGHGKCSSIPFKAMGLPWALKGDIRGSETVQSSEGMQGWLTMLFGIAANGLSADMPCLCRRLFMQR